VGIAWSSRNASVLEWCRLGMIAAAMVAIAGPAAAQSGWAAGAVDMMRVCIASLLAPEDLQATLSERGMHDLGPFHVPPGWDGTVYGSAGGKRNVTLGHLHGRDRRVRRL
jgi:hypothetical protein